MSVLATGRRRPLLLENIVILSLQHVLRLLLPLLVIPLVAKTVSSGEFGIYMYAVSAAGWLSTLLEYGFNISGSRTVAASGEADALKDVIVGVQSAKLVLVSASAVVGAALLLLMPSLQTHWEWTLTAWTLGVLIALHPNYYYQGRERLRLVAVVELAVGAATFVSVLLLVRSPEHFFRLPLILLSTRVLSLLALTIQMNREAELPWLRSLRWSAGLSALRTNFQIFVFQAAVSLYTSFNVIFLGFLAPPELVGPYATAERLMRAGLGFIGQISTALFSRLNALRDSHPEAMAATRRKALYCMAALGAAGAVVATLLAPVVSHWLLGDRMPAIVPILQTMAFVVPAIALSSTLGFQYLLVHHLERAFNRVILAAAALSLPSAYLLTMAYGPKGMALCWVVIEWLLTLAIVGLVRHSIKATKNN